jgi:hypothetical protein
MGKYVMLVQSQPRPGQDEEYHRWYDQEHVPDLLKIPGIIAGTRYAALPTDFPSPDHPNLAIYEIEADDIGAVMAEFNRRATEGLMPVSPAIEIETVKLWLYAQR